MFSPPQINSPLWASRAPSGQTGWGWVLMKSGPNSIKCCPSRWLRWWSYEQEQHTAGHLRLAVAPLPATPGLLNPNHQPEPSMCLCYLEESIMCDNVDLTTWFLDCVVSWLYLSFKGRKTRRKKKKTKNKHNIPCFCPSRWCLPSCYNICFF